MKFYGKVKRGNKRPYLAIPDQTGRKAIIFLDIEVSNGIDDSFVTTRIERWGWLIYANMRLRGRWQPALPERCV